MSHSFFKLFGGSSTNQYPKIKRKLPVNFQGFPKIKVEADCISCLLCQKLCPTGTIKIGKKDGKIHAEYEMLECMNCFICINACPKSRILSIEDFEFAEFEKENLKWGSK